MYTHSTSSESSSTSLPLAARIARILCKKLWLPRALYEALPIVYVLGGLAALLSALYLPGWTWILPYLLLLGTLAMHAGLAIMTLRWRFRRDKPGPKPEG
jgi:hypothetical protein